MKRIPSRILNEKPGFLGLDVFDLTVLGYTLILSHSILSQFGLELLSFVVAGLLGFFLIGIRMSHRPKVIRDFVQSKLIKRIYAKSYRGLK